MNTVQLRGMILSNLNEVKSVLLSPQSVEIVKWLKESQMTSANLAERLDININNASNRLQKMYKQGYLDRVVDRSSSGGVEYRYRTKKEFFEFL